MTKQIKTSIQIKANKETVWQVLMDFEKYPEWNPFIQSIAGEAKVGSTLTIKLQNMSFKPTVLVYKEHHEFKWLGNLWFKGVFDGAHRFCITDNKAGITTLEHSETFNGVLVPFFTKSLDNGTKKGFEEMNKALKKRIETTLNN